MLAVACGDANLAIVGLDDECAWELDVTGDAFDDAARCVDTDAVAECERAIAPCRDDRAAVGTAREIVE